MSGPHFWHVDMDDFEEFDGEGGLFLFGFASFFSDDECEEPESILVRRVGTGGCSFSLARVTLWI